MPFEYLDHGADVGIRGIGKSLEGAFEEGAKAMFNLMADVETVDKREEVAIRCQAGDLEALFVELLNELLFQRGVRGLLFSDLHLTRLAETEEGYELEGVAYGEPLDLTKHQVETEVKGATYFGLKYYREGGRHVVQCVLDV